MSNVRLHIPMDRWSSRLELNPAEKHHLVDVLRQKPGNKIEVFDGIQTIGRAVLHKEHDKWLLCMGPTRKQPDPTLSVCLGVALLKGKKFDQVVRQATEVGVGAIQPFSSRRSISRPDTERIENKELRWRTVAAEAARQSRRASIPTIKPCKPLEEILMHSRATHRALLHEGIKEPTLIHWLKMQPTSKDLMLLVGPEGGFTSDEIEKALDARFVQVGLGLPVLRAETAAIVAAAFACCQVQPK